VVTTNRRNVTSSPRDDASTRNTRRNRYHWYVLPSLQLCKTHDLTILAGLASLASAIPIRIVHLDSISPLYIIDVSTIAHTRHTGSSEIGTKLERLSSTWWKEVTESNKISSSSSEGFLAPPAVKHGKWHHRLGPHDHSIPQTDASPIPEWMCPTPLSSAAYTPIVARPQSGNGLVKIVTADGTVMYQIEDWPGKAHGGIGCVYGYVSSPLSFRPILILPAQFL
jgi:hypothetical protein